MKNLLTSFRISSRHISSKPEVISPLEGVRILDLTRILAGPFATMIMSDLGAEVIKVERPGVGDDTRTWGPPFIEGKTRESVYFMSVNRNKKSVCVDMKQREGQKIIKELADSSDVLMENYVPGKLESLGLGYEELSRSNPGLVYCSVSGFGPTGPHSGRGGYDVIAASMGGLMEVTGEREGDPAKVGVAMTDLMTALYAKGAVLAALLQRQRTGLGQKIDCNLLSTQVSAMTHLAGNWLNAGILSQRWGTAHASIVPYQTFRTRDGHMTVGCGNDKQFKEFCARIGRPDLGSSQDFLNNEARVKNRNLLLPVLAEVMSAKTSAQWSDLFQGVTFPYGPVNNMREVFEDPQVQHNQLAQYVEHPSLGRVGVVGPAVTFSSSTNKVRGPPPTLGQHTEEVLEELGYSQSDIDRLRRERVVT